MLYYIIVPMILVLMVVFLMFSNKADADEENIMEDVPILNVSRGELEKHALEISNYEAITKRASCKRRLVRSLDTSYRKILKGHDYVEREVRNKKELLQAAEWLLDNLYLIQKEYKDIRSNMPEAYYKNLPIMRKGILKGYPRIYYIAVELVSHTDGRVDEEILETFLNAYQKNKILTSGELWAFPIMIRIALIQNITKIVGKIVLVQKARMKGDIIADRIIDAFNHGKITEEIKKLSEEKITFSSPCIERLLKILRDNGVENPIVYKWIDNLLDKQETNAETLINVEHHKQSSYQVSIGNSITGIREIAAANWKENFEKLSYVEKVLRQDPLHIYENMDFKSRDHYRHRLERLSKYLSIPEAFIAKKAIECAQESLENEEAQEFEKHVGYYIIDKGVECLKSKVDFKKKGLAGITSAFIKGNVSLYIGTIILGTIILVSLITGVSFSNDNNPMLWKYGIIALALIIPCSEIIISISNWSINRLIDPRFIPKIEFRYGIPRELSTIVVIPTLLNNEKRVESLVEDMEVYYLANREDNIFFALLGDFKDSNQEHEESDKLIVETALKLVADLNKKYCKDKDRKEIFYFFCRHRQFNEKEGIWIGWERKRGKLEEFNSLLRGDKKTSYDVVSGSISNLYAVKYVITLDADTQLPMDSAKKLIGAMSHVLNRPYVDSKRKVVLRGHGLMQPRVSVGNLSANKTMFSKIFSGETGMDMYTTAISDIYEDLFDEGIFTGKGIYDIDVFNNILKGEIPQNTVLSHDLLEGSYVRAALVTDIELIDGYPAYYNSSSKRLHRWVRGDWQLLPWLLKKTPLNALSKWKIFDNLRRSLLTPSIMILTIISLGIFFNPDKWLVVAFISLLCPILFDVSEAVVSPIKGISLSGKVNSGKNIIEQFFLIFCFLPYQAYLMLDAVIRTLYRLLISKKNLLQWQTAADVEANSDRKLKDFIQLMWIGSVISIFVGILAFSNSPQTGMFMVPSCVIWFFSPWIAYSISGEIGIKKEELTGEQKEVLRRLSRRTWAYFEDFMSPRDNWLAPDNYQEDPPKGVAPRTSPTNMGMGLTSNLIAFDLGYIGILELEERLDKIVANMELLEKYRGHFYNWYNTRTSKPLHPRYISTVDSGNLVGYMWLVNESLEEYKSSPVINKKLELGIADTLKLANCEIEKSLGIKDFYSAIYDEKNDEEFNIFSWKMSLQKLWSKCREVENMEGGNELYWNKKAKHVIGKHLSEIQVLFPWVDIVNEKLDKSGKLREKLKELTKLVSLEDLPKEIENLKVDDYLANSKQNKNVVQEIKQLLLNGRNEIVKLIRNIEKIIERINDISENTNFRMLYDEKRQLFAIGYDVERDSIGNCYYDLLASEARQASFIAIAKGEVEQTHWFKLGRAMTLAGRGRGLVSWTGTMFEYLMPLIIMKNYPNTLMDETYRSIVDGQKNYGKLKGVPWGISESAFYNFDVGLNYQYKAFGVPGIGLKRGLANELVIAPYATVMALQVDLKGAFSNIKRLMEIGMEGRYGFYEAIDYTKERVPEEDKKALVKCFMVHHEGMSLMSLDNILRSNILQERFHRIPRVKATELILQEKVAKSVVYDREQKYDDEDVAFEKQNLVGRIYNTAKTEIPETHLMSNGNYSLMISNSGSGYGKKEDMTVYRWREDVTTDNTGMFFYIKNLNSNEFWSATYEPCKEEGEEYQVTFQLDKAEFERKDGNIRTQTEVTVSSEDNAEIRRISITNHSNHTRDIEITSYCEVTLAAYNADLVHPAFSNLFIKTDFIDNPGCIIANRRPRAEGSKIPWIMQTIAVDGKEVGSIQYETSRANFIGRGRNLSNPQALDNDKKLDMTIGAVLDPIISMRVIVSIGKGETCKLAYTTAVGNSSDEVIELAKKYSDMHNINRAFELAWSSIQVEMNYLGIKSSQANIYQSIASKILFLNTLFKGRADHIRNISKGQSSLWPYGISGDLPIVLLVIRDESHIDLVRQLLKAHEYWSLKGLKVDLVILNLQQTSYIQALQDLVRDLISSSHARDKQNRAGGVFVYNESTIEKDVIDFLIAISRLVIDGAKGSLLSQTKNNNEEVETGNNLEKHEVLPVDPTSKGVSSSYKFNVPELSYFNGIGGFDNENNAYVIVLKDYKNTPAPWINVISNSRFGFHVSESGVSYTWYKNSRENKLTTWSNDPVMDNEAEEIYIRDEITGEVWSISPKPIRDNGQYVIEHGFGYSTFKHEAQGVIGEMTMFVDMDESVKLCRIKLKNNSNEKRLLSVTYYAKLVMGVTHEQTAQYIYTNFDEKNQYIYARNPYSEHFGNLICYMKMFGGNELSYTGDRKDFIGRGGNYQDPKALKLKKLSNLVGAGLDPCFAQNMKLSLNKGEEKEILVLLGQDESFDSIERIINKYDGKADEELDNVKAYWRNLLGTIQVETPDKSMDLMINGWLMYQVISCRFWARTAFYQSGGAYGFRDQLQDVMAIGYLNPKITREYIIYSASKQYLEGDVQHWWHPVVESGIRTRFSDDLLWLPYVTIDYIQNTGDYSILDEEAGYLEDEPLKEGEDERYNISRISNRKESIYEHCIKAIEISLRFGEHNIPLMGSGDWNDGMSTIGNKGRGESVWLGWFLYSILDRFVNLCNVKGDTEKVKKYSGVKEFIKENLEKNAWDGGWYRRAYFDDGTPLGSMQNDECQIDSLSQSWSVISGAGKEARVKEAMGALHRNLIKEDKGIVMLLTPAFDKSTKLEPGYIKGYVPGVRENGGQYTHASIWVVLALAKMGENNKAWKIFNMINPINHAKSYLNCQVYKVEPYVMTADVYAVEPHTGRGGWSWYTGAAGWMYRTGIEGILGFRFEGSNGFTVNPCVPDEWDSYNIFYNRGKSKYKIHVLRGENKGIWLDNNKVENRIIPFLEDGEHEVKVVI